MLDLRFGQWYLTSFSSGERFLYLYEADFALSPVIGEPLTLLSANTNDQVVSGSFFGGFNNAFSFSSFVFCASSRFCAVMLICFLGFGFGFGFGLTFAFGLAFGFGLAFAFFFGVAFFTAFLPVVVFLVADVLPVCPFGLPSGFARVVVAYDRRTTDENEFRKGSQIRSELDNAALCLQLTRRRGFVEKVARATSCRDSKC